MQWHSQIEMENSTRLWLAMLPEYTQVIDFNVEKTSGMTDAHTLLVRPPPYQVVLGTPFPTSSALLYPPNMYNMAQQGMYNLNIPQFPKWSTF